MPLTKREWEQVQAAVAGMPHLSIKGDVLQTFTNGKPGDDPNFYIPKNVLIQLLLAFVDR